MQGPDARVSGGRRINKGFSNLGEVYRGSSKGSSFGSSKSSSSLSSDQSRSTISTRSMATFKALRGRPRRDFRISTPSSLLSSDQPRSTNINTINSYVRSLTTCLPERSRFKGELHSSQSSQHLGIASKLPDFGR